MDKHLADEASGYFLIPCGILYLYMQVTKDTEQDKLLVQQLITNERDAYLSIYRLYYPELARFILRNNGNRQDAEDMFQETLLILIQKIRNENFVLQSSLKTFLFAVNRNQWLKRLRVKRMLIPAEVLQETDLTIDALEEEIKPAAENWLQRLFENITGHCVILMTRIFLKQQEPDVLIRELGYKNVHSFQNQKYKCINQLRKAGKNLSVHG